VNFFWLPLTTCLGWTRLGWTGFGSTPARVFLLRYDLQQDPRSPCPILKADFKPVPTITIYIVIYIFVDPPRFLFFGHKDRVARNMTDAFTLNPKALHLPADIKRRIISSLGPNDIVVRVS
jgi:hypothetical protein